MLEGREFEEDEMAEETDKKEAEVEEPQEAGSGEAPSAVGEEETGQAVEEETAPLAPVNEATEVATVSEVSSDDRLLSVLMWVSMVLLQLPLLSAVLLFIEPSKSRPFQRHHAVSSIIFWVVALIYEGAAMIVFTILSIISLGCLAVCGWVIFLLPHLLALYYALKAFNGNEVEIPYITEFAKRQGWI